jgi:choline dehydrogenase-like flavoprotein
MPFITADAATRTHYDVIVVGSGAGGGQTAYTLTMDGARVLMLEAGRKYDPLAETPMFQTPDMAPLRGTSTPDKPFGFYDATVDGGWQVPGEPYVQTSEDDAGRFDWWRARMLGGRTNHWGRISLRFGPEDFRGKTRDGLGDDWPIGYEDLAPFYDQVDDLIGVFGRKEGIHKEPDGKFLPPPKPRCYELLVKKASDNLKITCIPSRLSIITQPKPGRQACHYCGQCNRGCQVKANFSSPDVLIAPALATGRLTLLTNAMAREVTIGPDGLATGVQYIDKESGEDRHVAAKVVVLAASAFESARLLLNSKSSLFPQGLANSSGVVGKYITDTTGSDVSGFIPAMVDHIPHNEDGVGGMHVYMPWWLDNKKLDFPRGYHIEVYGGLGQPGYGFMGGIQRYPGKGGYGAKLKEDYRRYYGATIGFSGRGEQIPNDKCYTEIDPNVVDKFGIPVLRFHWEWTDNELNQVKHMQETFRALIHEMGGTPFSPMPTKEQGYGIAAGGRIIHELGGVRMGNDPKSSALNRNCQAHDVKNLFVADGGPFVTQANKNPTWTILALSWRTADYIAQQRKQGAL